MSDVSVLQVIWWLRSRSHPMNSVDPATGVNTQHADSNWSATEEKLKKMKGTTYREFRLEYLQEFTWRRWYGKLHPNGCFERLIEDIVEQYPL